MSVQVLSFYSRREICRRALPRKPAKGKRWRRAGATQRASGSPAEGVLGSLVFHLRGQILSQCCRSGSHWKGFPVNWCARRLLLVTPLVQLVAQRSWKHRRPTENKQNEEEHSNIGMTLFLWDDCDNVIYFLYTKCNRYGLNCSTIFFESICFSC